MYAYVESYVFTGLVAKVLVNRFAIEMVGGVFVLFDYYAYMTSDLY